MRFVFLYVGALLLPGCVRTLPQSSLGNDALLVFADFDDDPQALPGVLDDMDTSLDGMDLQSGVRDRLYRLPELSEAFYGGADVPSDLDTAHQMRMSLVGLSRHSVDDNLLAQTQVNQTCINAKSVKCQERDPVQGSDAGCFVAGTCDVYRTDNTIRIKTVLNFWIQAPVDFRRVTMPDGRKAAVSRTWFEKPFTNDSGKRTWTQRFGVDVYIEDPDDASRTRRYYATWLAPIVAGLPGAIVQSALRHGLQDGFTNPDDWLDSQSCDVTLDQCMADSPF